MISGLIAHNGAIPWDGLKYGVSFIGVFFYIYTNIGTASILSNFPNAEVSYFLPYGPSISALVCWFVTELVFYFGVIVSNMLFILIRTFLKNKIQLDSKIDEKEKLPQIDTISALNEIATAWHTQFVPLIVSLYLNFFLPKDLFELKSINLVMWVILICNCLTAVIIFFLIFVSWKTGPAWWVAISPKLYVLMTISCYIIMPTGVMILSLYYFIADYDQMHLSPNLSWVVAYSVLSLSRIIEFFVTIKPIHINDA